MKKRLLLTFIVALSLSLVSCAGLFGNDDTAGDPPKNEKVEYTRVITADGELDLSLVLTGMRDVVGPMVTLGLDTETPAAKGEVVFGDTARAITAAAKAALERQMMLSSQSYDVGYIIYAEDGCVAVYWTEPEMADMAVQKFIDLCINDKRLVLSGGVIAEKYYSAREYESNKQWIALETVATPETVAALKRINAYFDGHKLISWMANLYDPDIGGFYYSRDARDYSIFLPDLESTQQILAMIYNLGAISIYDELPEVIRQKILEFVWSTQSPVDGYFYHPQWPQDKSKLNTDRYGRDIGWATTIIKNLNIDTDGDGVLENQYPLYCAPNGDKCALHNGTDDTCSFPVTTSAYASRIDGYVTNTLTSGVSSAVSRVSDSYVTPTASVSGRPDYSSATAFKAWLEAYNENIKENSGYAHNLAALRPEITAKGYAIIVYEHLYETQKELLAEQLAAGETPTGLWQRTINFDAVWGLLKYAGFYTNGAQGGPFYEDCIPYAARTCIEVILMDPDAESFQMNDLYNMWTGIANLISIVRAYNKNDAAVADIYTLVRERAPELIDATIARMDGFKQEDGSFSYNADGTTQPKVYGTVVCFGNKEGDVNAVALCCNMYNSIYRALNYTAVPIFTKADGQTFINILLESESIDKKEPTSGTIDYESQSYKTAVSWRLASSGAKVETCDDPDGAKNQVLAFTTAAGKGDYLYFTPTGTGTGCYIFETDIYVSSDCSDTALYQATIADLFMLEFTKLGNTVMVEADQDASKSAGEEFLCEFDVDTWVTIRVECYPANDDTGLTLPELKMWLDGELVAVSENYIGFGKSAPQDSDFTQVQIYTLMSATGTSYFDNTFISKEDKVFDEYDETVADSRNP